MTVAGARRFQGIRPDRGFGLWHGRPLPDSRQQNERKYPVYFLALHENPSAVIKLRRFLIATSLFLWE